MIFRGKKGLSGVIVTLILILLVLVAVGVVWVVVQNILESGTEQIDLGSLTISMDIEDIKIKEDSVDVSVKRNSGKADLKGIIFIVGDGENTQTFREDVSLDELETQTFNLPYKGSVDVIEISPVIESSSGKENIGNPIDNEDKVPNGEFCVNLSKKGFSDGTYFLNPYGEETRIETYCDMSIAEDNLISNWEMVGDDTILAEGWGDHPETSKVTGPDGGSVFAHDSTETASTRCYNWAKTSLIPANPEKTYEFSIWIKSTESGMNNYLGFYLYDSSQNRIEGSWNNPYFKTSEGDLNEWKEFRGRLGPSSAGGATGCDTSETNGNDWCASPDTRYFLMRFGSCYDDGSSSAHTYFTKPKIKEL